MRQALLHNIKKMVHKNETLETFIFFVWSIITLIRVKKIFKQIPESHTHSSPVTIIIHTVRSFPVPGLVYFDAVFAHAFFKIGAKAHLVFHDGVLSNTDAETKVRSEKPQQRISALLGTWLKRVLRVPETISYRDYISPKEITTITQTVHALAKEELETHIYLGTYVGLHAKASAIRYFLTGYIDLHDAHHVEILRKNLINAMISTLVAQKIIQDKRPTALFTLHGVYSTWGPFQEFFRKSGIDTYVYNNIPVRFGHMLFNHNSFINELNAKEEWARAQAEPLRDDERDTIQQFIQSRIVGNHGEQKMYVRNFNPLLKKEETLKKLFQPPFAKRFVMFPNLAWDIAVIEQEGDIFKNLFDRIDTTLSFFQKNPTYQLIIKPHPAELVWEDGNTVSITKYITQKYAPLPQNIFLLPADIPVLAYDLLSKNNTVALMYNGTVGLECALLQFPFLAASPTIHYAKAGLTYTLTSSEHFLNTLKNPDEVVRFVKSNLSRAMKYGYFYFFKSPIRMPMYRDDVWATLDWDAFFNISKLLADDSNVIKVCKKIIAGKDILNPL